MATQKIKSDALPQKMAKILRNNLHHPLNYLIDEYAFFDILKLKDIFGPRSKRTCASTEKSRRNNVRNKKKTY